MRKSFFIVIPLLTVFLLVPLNIYLIGKEYGAGIQWAFFKYQATPFGSMWFTFLQDIDYIMSGIIAGRSALSLVLWLFASLLILFFLIFALWSLFKDRPYNHTFFGIVIIAAGIIYLMSCMVHYGPTLSGPAGFCIPIGIPAVFAVGFLIYSEYGRRYVEDPIEEKSENEN